MYWIPPTALTAGEGGEVDGGQSIPVQHGARLKAEDGVQAYPSYGTV